MAKLRHSRLQVKKLSTVTLVLSMLFMLTVVSLMLLGLGIFSLPINDDDSLPNDLTSYRCMASERGKGMGKRGEQWTEVLSWESRAFLYHNFLPCSNPDCLYLHEIGSQEDSFTKDEIIAAYTRVQQITGTTNNTQRRAGTMLPPPVDDYCPNSSASTAKPISKNAPNNMVLSSQKDSTSNGSTGRSIGLPAGALWL